MKRTQKRIFGVFGLFIVAIMTILAAMVPSPEASANSSVTDVIRIRVVGSVVSAKFTKPSENIIITDDEVNYAFNYENADEVKLSLSYTDKNGDTINLPNYEVYPDLGYIAGDKNETLDFAALGLSFGKYILSLYATGSEGTELLYDSISVEYVPVIASASQNEDDGLVDIYLDSYSDQVDTVEIYIDGELIATVNKDDFDEVIELDFGDRASGEYTLDIIAKGADGEILYKPYQVTVEYEGINVPNTGFFFQNMNISREDYLITGLIIFFVFGIVAFGVVARGSKRK